MSQAAILPLSQIIKTENALRQVDLENEAFLEIKDSVEKYGVLNAISVRRTDDPEIFELVDGRHRLTAAQEAGLTEIPCTIFDDMSDHDQLVAQIVANVGRVDTKPAEYANNIKRLLEQDPDVNVHDVARMLAKSAQWVTKMLRITKLPEAIQEHVDNGNITLQNSVALSELPADAMADWVERAMNMPGEEFVPEVTAEARRLKDEARKGRAATPEVFTAKAKARKGADLVAEFEGGSPTVTSLCSNADQEAGARLALAWVVRMDEETVSEAEAIWNAKKKARDEQKARRAKEKLEKDEAKAAQKAAELRDKLAEIQE